MEDSEVNVKWRFTGFYGTPYTQDREESWATLKNLYHANDIPWIVAGDFNKIMYGFEKNGGLPRDENRMEAFRKALEDCQLYDMGFSKRWFTWERGNLLETNIQERLDRGVANTTWIHKKEAERRKENCFKFEAWSILEDSFEDEVKRLWDMIEGDFLQKMDLLRKGLQKWARQLLKNRKWRKKDLIERLSVLTEAERDDSNLAKLIDTKIQLNFEIEKEEYFWEQRACLNWLKLGDRNTRQRHNRIEKLQNENGGEAEDLVGLEGIAWTYFQNLFTAGVLTNMEYLLSEINRCISEEDNRMLIASYTGEEIREALFQMGSTKAPGEDSFPALFYQRCWPIVGKEVVDFCLHLLNGDMEVCPINLTRIVLILKVTNPTNMTHF
ncbi:hypothetical protein PVK06_000353 [Gossypium arboreum]|uniref:Reverse transcriptase n=1 Tax=Gossypium arboreum TaxID=29729 RepID=A0ABR0QZ73_GOSAR|nr:hypothetical protein PVK06_000353 [Gossypium arboreum]